MAVGFSKLIRRRRVLVINSGTLRTYARAKFSSAKIEINTG
jgi:hypothetical protein